jgi:hypothetical protein
MLCGWTHIDIIIGFAADLSCTSLAGGWMLDAVRLLIISMKYGCTRNANL